MYFVVSLLLFIDITAGIHFLVSRLSTKFSTPLNMTLHSFFSVHQNTSFKEKSTYVKQNAFYVRFSGLNSLE